MARTNRNSLTKRGRVHILYTSDKLVILCYNMTSFNTTGIFLFSLILLLFHSLKIVNKRWKTWETLAILNSVTNTYSIKTKIFKSDLYKGVHLTLPPHIISVQVKSWSMLHHGSVGASLKQNKRNIKKPNPNPNP